MIARYVLHLEFHRGYRPRLSLTRAPYPGQPVVDGGVHGVLIPCTTCSGRGYLLEPDREVPPTPPTPTDTSLAAGRFDGQFTGARVAADLHGDDPRPPAGKNDLAPGRTAEETLADVSEMVRRLAATQGGGVTAGYVLRRIRSVLGGERPDYQLVASDARLDLGQASITITSQSVDQAGRAVADGLGWNHRAWAQYGRMGELS